MKVWIAQQVVEHEGADLLGVHVTEEGAKGLCAADLDRLIARDGYPYVEPGSTIEWAPEDGWPDARRGGINGALYGDYYYTVHPFELAGMPDASAIADVVMAHTDEMCRDRHCGYGFGYHDTDSRGERRVGSEHVAAKVLERIGAGS